MEQKTIVFIKPEALGFADTIKGYLGQIGHIAVERRVTLTEDMIDVVYPHLPPIIRSATIEHLSGQEIIVYLIEGQLIIDRMLDFIGYDKDPTACSGHTLRHWCSTVKHREPKLLFDGSTLYNENYIHRARTRHEVVQQAKVLLGIELEEH